jgi:hypothetical protein
MASDPRMVRMRLMRPGIIGEFLCLDYPGGPAVDKKQVIARPGWKLKFPHRHTKGRIAIELLHVLDDLARGFKRGVDLLVFRLSWKWTFRLFALRGYGCSCYLPLG